MALIVKRWEQARKKRRHCLLVTLDVKNAFNTVRWSSVVRDIKRRNFPRRLVDLIRSYLDERWIIYKGGEVDLPFQVFGGYHRDPSLAPYYGILCMTTSLGSG